MERRTPIRWIMINDGLALLNLAVKEGHLDVVNVLLDGRAEPELEGRRGQT